MHCREAFQFRAFFIFQLVLDLGPLSISFFFLFSQVLEMDLVLSSACGHSQSLNFFFLFFEYRYLCPQFISTIVDISIYSTHYKRSLQATNPDIDATSYVY